MESSMRVQKKERNGESESDKREIEGITFLL